MRASRLPVVPALAALLAVLLAGCSSEAPAPAASSPGSTPAATTSAPAPSGTSASPSSAAPGPVPDVQIAETVTEGLTAPWGLAFLPDGSALVAERDSARVVRVPAQGGPFRNVGRVEDVAPGGEGGLLGLAVPPGDDPTYVLAYLSAADENRGVRLEWDGELLGAQRTILDGIPRSGIHNGGRMRFGPDGYLYVSTGDASDRDLAQDGDSLAGKILRVTADGAPAPGNPVAGSPVWSLGHRNVQGLAFDSAGRLWASEFGQNELDELNLVRGAKNYGWPLYEGPGDDPSYVDPQVTWPTSEASPSGLAIVDDVAYVAALRGERLWQVPVRDGEAGKARAWFTGELGRLRTVEPAPDGSLWLVTNNTDGRGSPRDGDDRILRLTLTTD